MCNYNLNNFIRNEINELIFEEDEESLCQEDIKHYQIYEKIQYDAIFYEKLIKVDSEDTNHIQKKILIVCMDINYQTSSISPSRIIKKIVFNYNKFTY